MAYLGKARDFLTLLNLTSPCIDEGFEEVEIRYVGGLWVVFEFTSSVVCENIMQNESMDHWLSSKRKWDKHFVREDRLVWLDIEGLPLLGWSK